MSHSKPSGSVLIVTLVIGFVMLSLALTATNVLLSDIALSRDFLASEKAYFSAESGMERALLYLRQEPVDWIDNERIEINAPEDQIVRLFIPNRVTSSESFSFALESFKSRKFRMKVDMDGDPGAASPPIAAHDFSLQIAPEAGGGLVGTDQVHWKVLCKQNYTRRGRPRVGTVSIQKVEPASRFVSYLSVSGTALRGDYDRYAATGETETGSGLVSHFLQDASLLPDSCFFSVTNNANRPLTFSFRPNAGKSMSPHKVKVRAEGLSDDRQKILVFDYFQKNLGELFDFVFFHTGN